MEPLPTFDVTARKAHQWAMVVLVALAYLTGDRTGLVLLALAGAIMLAGRFWWPADLVRQFVWRVAEPAGWLTRSAVHEDRATRRLARVMGGTIWLLSAVLVALGAATLGWVLAALIAVMVALDATLDFCALCFAFAQLDRHGWLPAGVRHGVDQPCA
ncbi:MAG: DUF4395 family protein, partial [Chloroflexi bacterium]|nr:DUF4395 family protein [Chloroflexota bacterium]